MLETGGDPDGHCLVDEVCPRCAMDSAPVPPPTVAAASPTLKDTPPANSSHGVQVTPLDSEPQA
jgi:hypothetical protein